MAASCVPCNEDVREWNNKKQRHSSRKLLPNHIILAISGNSTVGFSISFFREAQDTTKDHSTEVESEG